MRIKTLRDLGNLIKDRRQELKLSQEALATRVGVTRQWLISVEKGKRRADVSLVLRTLTVLGLLLDVRPVNATATMDWNEFIDDVIKKPGR